MSTKPIMLGGKTYYSIEEMPPDVREKYELAMCLLGDPDENNLLHTAETLNGSTNQNRHSEPQGMENLMASRPIQDAPSALLSPDQPQASPMILPDTSEGWSLAFAALFLLILCALAMASVWYFFLL